jgi:hypothetical protein
MNSMQGICDPLLDTIPTWWTDENYEKLKQLITVSLTKWKIQDQSI